MTSHERWSLLTFAAGYAAAFAIVEVIDGHFPSSAIDAALCIVGLLSRKLLCPEMQR